ncbi:hypothetical protein Q604_UNBC11386G0001, partial [human gut metagenome]
VQLNGDVGVAAGVDLLAVQDRMHFGVDDAGAVS